MPWYFDQRCNKKKYRMLTNNVSNPTLLRCSMQICHKNFNQRLYIIDFVLQFELFSVILYGSAFQTRIWIRKHRSLVEKGLWWSCCHSYVLLCPHTLWLLLWSLSRGVVGGVDHDPALGAAVGGVGGTCTHTNKLSPIKQN